MSEVRCRTSDVRCWIRMDLEFNKSEGRLLGMTSDLPHLTSHL